MQSAAAPGAKHAPLYFLSGYFFSGRHHADLRGPLPSGVDGTWRSGRLRRLHGSTAVCEQKPNWTVTELQTGALPHFEDRRRLHDPLPRVPGRPLTEAEPALPRSRPSPSDSPLETGPTPHVAAVPIAPRTSRSPIHHPLGCRSTRGRRTARPPTFGGCAPTLPHRPCTPRGSPQADRTRATNARRFNRLDDHRCPPSPETHGWSSYSRAVDRIVGQRRSLRRARP